MRAMVLEAIGEPLQLRDLPEPAPLLGEVRVEVEACAVCRTDLHVVDGELGDTPLPLVPGHQIVGRIEGSGSRVGIPWLGSTCGECTYCAGGQENLCDAARFTGFDLPGGFAESVVADRRFCFPLSDAADPVAIAPLLCAGLIGYRALGMTGAAQHVGLYGFGAAAHILAQVLRHQGRSCYAFTRAGDEAAQAFARSLGAVWAGASEDTPPRRLDAAILFAPVGSLVPAALAHVRKGGVVVCGGIHMSDIPQFPYSLLWGERQLRSVANLTRRDGEEFLALAEQVGIQTSTRPFALEEANLALACLREGRIEGSGVVCPGLSAGGAALSGAEQQE
jgi:propanol-preferring alcohol dehydrogenase